MFVSGLMNESCCMMVTQSGNVKKSLKNGCETELKRSEGGVD